ncbi:MAG: hypothetical protein Q7J77_10420 [Undibacterium sp.]|nr:hypothetical protein [Undibacterium sp.]
MSNQIDSSIPVLTEIIPPSSFLTSPSSATNTFSSSSNDEVNEENGKNSISAEEWQQLEQTVRENALRQVLSRVDFVLEHRVRDSLADVLQTAVENLAVEIRAGLHKTMEEVITRAVTQEISKAKILK